MGNFYQWFARRSGHRPPIIPPPLSIPAIVAQAGPQGISFGELRSVVDLDGRLLDQLLRALVSVNQIRATRRGDQTVYTATGTAI